MADVGEEPALDRSSSISFRLVSSSSLRFWSSSIAQGEFAEARLAVKVAAGDDDDAGQDEKIEVVDELARTLAAGSGRGEGSRQVNTR